MGQIKKMILLNQRDSKRDKPAALEAPAREHKRYEGEVKRNF